MQTDYTNGLDECVGRLQGRLRICNAEECRKLAVYFASKVRPEVARDMSKSVLSKSRLHKSHAFMEIILGQKCLFKV